MEGRENSMEQPPEIDRTNIVRGRHTPEKRALARRLRENMTPQERRLWAQLRANRLHGWPFRRQQIIDGFIADFYCHAAGLVIEVDGASHHQRADYDAERDRILTARGLRVLRVTNTQIETELEGVLAAILEMIGRAPTYKAHPPPSPP